MLNNNDNQKSETRKTTKEVWKQNLMDIVLEDNPYLTQGFRKIPSEKFFINH